MSIPVTSSASADAHGLSPADYADLAALIAHEDTPPVYRTMARQCLAVAARDSLLAYAYLCPTDAQFVGSWHHEVICRELEQLVDTPGAALAISCPPRHGKSRIASHLYPGWVLGRSPKEHIIAASYAAQLADTNSRAAQRVIDSAGHLAAFGGSRLGAANIRTMSGRPLRNVEEWEIVDARGERTGGRYYCAGIGGGITGRGWSLGIIDDYLRGARDADSALIRDRQWDWYTSEFRTRAMGARARRLCIATRWHMDDLLGRCYESEGRVEEGGIWRVVTLPAIMDGDTERHPDDTRADGEPLWPTEPFFFDEHYYASLRSGADGASNRTWEALYQQRPRPADGALWRTSYLRSYKLLPSREDAPLIHDGDLEFEALSLPHRYCTVDVALGVRDGDWTVICYWGYDPVVQRLYLFDMRRERWGAPETMDAIRYALRESRWRPQRVWIESVQYQAGLIQLAKREGLSVGELRPDRDKRARLLAVEHWGEQGRVYHQHGAPWRGPLERELLAFTGARDDTDDQVDAYVYGLTVAAELARSNRKPPSYPAVRRRDYLG